MNAQSNRPLTKFAGSERGGAALSVVLNKKPVIHDNSIQSKDMIDSQRLTDEPVVLITFTIESTGFYNVSLYIGQIFCYNFSIVLGSGISQFFIYLLLIRYNDTCIKR